MQKRYLPALIALSSLALSACGSSGGGGGNNQAFNPGNPGNPGANTPSVSGQLLTVNQNGSPRGTAPVNYTDNINQIIVAGRSIELVPQGFHSNIIVELNDRNMERAIGTNLANARWGYLKQTSQTEGYVFAHGKPTEQMPTNNGMVKYQGYSVHRGHTPSTAVQGTANFNVDFANKTLTGTVSPSGVSPIDLQATISGNTFSGNHNGVQTNGGFYGKDAAELAGVYRSQGQFSGAFGAKKQ